MLISVSALFFVGNRVFFTQIGVSAFHLACWLRKEEIAAVLIDLGANIESKSEVKKIGETD